MTSTIGDFPRPKVDFTVRTGDHLQEDSLYVAEQRAGWRGNANSSIVRCLSPFSSRSVLRQLRPENAVVCCEEVESGEKVIVRVYGKNTGVLINRRQELMTMIELHAAGQGADVFGLFSNGYIYGYVAGRTLTVAEMSDAHFSSLIARRLAAQHRMPFGAGGSESKLFNVIEKWLDAVTVFEDPDQQSFFTTHFDLNVLRTEYTALKAVLLKLNAPTVFAHNDLLCNNILYDSSNDSISFIDFEYSSASFRGFDIGNHFCEYAGIEDPVDYTLYPSRETQLVWLTHYLAAFHDIDESAVSASEVSALYNEVNLFSLAAHFYWGTWGLIRALARSSSFDYLAYAKVRFDEYYRRKDEVLSL